MAARLPVPGSDAGDWGVILNDFLEVSLNQDGTIQPQAVVQAGGVASVNTIVPNASGNVTLTAANVGAPTTLAGDTDVSISSPQNNQVLTYNSGASTWENQVPPSAPVSSVFGRTGTVVAQSGDYTAAQVGALPSTDDLSAIANVNATAGNVSMNSHKITSLQNGSASTDAASFGQIPTSAATIGGLLAANNLSDVASASTALGNLGALALAGGTLTDGANIAVGTTTGTEIGTSTSQKLGFFGAVPVTQQSASDDLGVALANLGLRASGGYPLTVQGGLSITGPYQAYAQADTGNVSLSLSSGTSPVRLANAASNTITYTLPSTTNAGYSFTVAKIDSSANTVTVDSGSGNTINGTRYFILGTQYAYVTVISTSTSGVWYVIDSGPNLLLTGDTMTGWLAPAVVSLTFGLTININAAQGNDFRLTLTASTGTVAIPTNPVDGQPIRIQITQGTGGSFTLAWTTSGTGCFDFGTAGAPTLSTTATDTDILGFVYNAAKAKWLCVGTALGF